MELHLQMSCFLMFRFLLLLANQSRGQSFCLDRINQGLEEVLVARHGHLALGDGILDRDLLRSDGDEVLILQVDHHIGRASLTVRHLQSLQINDCLREANGKL